MSKKLAACIICHSIHEYTLITSTNLALKFAPPQTNERKSRCISSNNSTQPVGQNKVNKNRSQIKSSSSWGLSQVSLLLLFCLFGGMSSNVYAHYCPIEIVKCGMKSDGFSTIVRFGSFFSYFFSSVCRLFPIKKVPTQTSKQKKM